jgi:hypothetical protein
VKTEQATNGKKKRMRSTMISGSGLFYLRGYEVQNAGSFHRSQNYGFWSMNNSCLILNQRGSCLIVRRRILMPPTSFRQKETSSSA